jgi:hypothetical protein
MVCGNFYFLSFFGSSKAGIDRPAGVDRPSSYCVIHVNGAQPWKLIFLHNTHIFKPNFVSESWRLGILWLHNILKRCI